MRIVVLGGTGQMGKLVVEQAKAGATTWSLPLDRRESTSLRVPGWTKHFPAPTWSST
ncbi:hypothetical protein ACETU7_15440 [Rhodococcus sp. 3Y1]